MIWEFRTATLIISSASWTLPTETLDDDTKTATVRYVPLGSLIPLGSATFADSVEGLLARSALGIVSICSLLEVQARIRANNFVKFHWYCVCSCIYRNCEVLSRDSVHEDCTSIGRWKLRNSEAIVRTYPVVFYSVQGQFTNDLGRTHHIQPSKRSKSAMPFSRPGCCKSSEATMNLGLGS